MRLNPYRISTIVLVSGLLTALVWLPGPVLSALEMIIMAALMTAIVITGWLMFKVFDWLIDKMNQWDKEHRS